MATDNFERKHPRKNTGNTGHFAAVQREVATLAGAPVTAPSEPAGWYDMSPSGQNEAVRQHVEWLRLSGQLPEYGSKVVETSDVRSADDLFALVKADLKVAESSGVFPDSAKLRCQKRQYGSYHVTVECDDPDEEIEAESVRYAGVNEVRDRTATWKWAVAARAAQTIGDAYNYDHSDPHDEFRNQRFSFRTTVDHTVGAQIERRIADPKISEQIARIDGCDLKDFKRANDLIGYPANDISPAQCAAVAKRLGYDDYPKEKLNANMARFHLAARITHQINPSLGWVYMSHLEGLR
jgi:hypothetical protein